MLQESEGEGAEVVEGGAGETAGKAAGEEVGEPAREVAAHGDAAGSRRE